MTAWKPPGSDTMSERFARLERKINELTRRSPLSVAAPVCVVHMSGAWSFPNSEGENWRPVTSWRNVAEIDTLGAYRYNVGGDTYWELPYTGLYTIQMRSNWGGTPTLPNRVSTQLFLNGFDYYQNMIEEETHIQNGSSILSYNLLSQSRIFQAGDRIRVNFWSQRRYATHRYENGRDASRLFIRYEGTV